MPELPEVESLRRQLEPRLAGRRIQAVEAPDSPRFHDLGLAVGRRIAGIDRRGKFLFLRLGDRDLLIHLGLTGWLCLGPADRRPPHVRAEWLLDGGERLYFEDPRRLGRLYMVPAGKLPASETLRRLGPEPLDPRFTVDYLASRIAGMMAPAKALLLDQAIAAGVGNIYSDEALFRARVHPARRRLSTSEAAAIHAAIQEVMRESLAAGGIETGTFVPRVHRRGGKPCPECGMPVASRRIAGRTAYFCPRCQPADYANSP
ncbi:MAG: DNA-formamidopyrimidine glycosylase [Candidatus Sericytochromatia bacterium]|nr:DNA-formamidopyrimidine glycosylase [Candidatus Tanganyikabacteria bacterium]